MASSSSFRYALGVRSTTTVVFLCLLALALTWVESVYRIVPPTNPFSMAWRRISLKICSGMSLSPLHSQGRGVRRLLCQTQPAKPFICHVIVNLFLQPPLRTDAVE